MSEAPRILYATMGQGNGHLSRTRVIAPELERLGAQVDHVFSGRLPDRYYDMERFGSYRTLNGISLDVKDGCLSTYGTIFKNAARLPGIAADIKNLDVRSYDVVITDYEPLAAWASILRGVRSVGIGHQYAFLHDVPGRTGKRMRLLPWIAPSKTSIGLHFHHFGQKGIAPPVVTSFQERPVIDGKILVYLPYETRPDIEKFLNPFRDHQFYVYSPEVKVPEETGNIHFLPVSERFKDDFADCSGLVTNGGFVAPAEALVQGKKVLAKPLTDNPEQAANARALEELGYGRAMYGKLDSESLGDWLYYDRAIRVSYPNVAAAFAKWVVSGSKDPQEFIDPLWDEVVETPVARPDLA